MGGGGTFSGRGSDFFCDLFGGGGSEIKKSLEQGRGHIFLGICGVGGGGVRIQLS